MTRVDFYILDEQSPQQRQDFACRLIQKTARLGHRIYVHCDSADEAHALDHSLWAFQPHSFIPHRLLQQDNSDNPIEIGYGDNPGSHHDLLINLSLTIPAFFSRFERVAEIVTQDAAVLDATRTSYRFYASKNYPLHRHDLRKNS